MTEQCAIQVERANIRNTRVQRAPLRDLVREMLGRSWVRTEPAPTPPPRRTDGEEEEDPELWE